ncbi:DUF3828 domain-containing protein [Brevundimonas sp. BR2-1]|uniref:DUF3828 domain-containing protein n=1 Tax=Brevundimonas sp. BR2-1 TaxID=3031123 RepID=UPI0030992DB7
MRHVLIAAAVLALAACTPAPAGPEGADAPAAATTATAEAFVRSLYEEGDTPPGASGRVEERPIWSARTQALIAESDRLTPEGYVGFFEADPICDCQDGTPVLQSATATSTGPDRADVAVVQGFAEAGGPVHRKTWNLVREDGQWRVDDQHYESMGEFPQEPMLQRLTVWIAGAKAPGAWKGD